MPYQEQALSFRCQGDSLYGVLSLPERPAARGVLIVVGGPQYRAGSHRQFTLLARALADQGVAALRFDYRGMGDSEGAARDFEAVDDDLRAAIDQFFLSVPALREIVLWGLCDGASAALFYGQRDPRVSGMVLINPWVRTDSGLAKATLQHYYRDRLLQRALWLKIARGQFNYGAALASLLRLLRSALGRPAVAVTAAGGGAPATLPQRMQAGLQHFGGRVLLILSGNDLTAQEFQGVVQASPRWQALLAAPRVAQHRLEPADHTFSRRVWHDQVTHWTAEWLRSW
jgi:exosortase A-associated hydrolase 1